MRIAPHGSLTPFSMIATNISWNEGDLHSVQSTLGDDCYMFLTGKNPTQVSIAGTVIYPACHVPYTLGTFWDEYRASRHRKPVKMILDGAAYWIMITNLTLQASSAGDDTEGFVLTGTGVRS